LQDKYGKTPLDHAHGIHNVSIVNIISKYLETLSFIHFNDAMTLIEYYTSDKSSIFTFRDAIFTMEIPQSRKVGFLGTIKNNKNIALTKYPILT